MKNLLLGKAKFLSLVLVLILTLSSIGIVGAQEFKADSDVSYSYIDGEIKLDWGTKNTGGYDIEIKDFNLDNNTLIVDYTLTSPGGAPVPQVITNPTDTKAVPEELKENFDEIELNLLEHTTLDEKEIEEPTEEKNFLYTIILKLIRMLPFVTS